MCFRYNAREFFWVWFLCLFVLSIETNAQNELGQLSLITKNLHAHDIVYDNQRDLLYATIGGSAGFPNGNSIAIIDPANLEVIKYVTIGSEPRRLAMLPNDDLVYVGINGAASFRRFSALNHMVGPLIPLRSRNGLLATAIDFAIDPADSQNVVISCREVGSSSVGNLRVFGPVGELSKIDYTNGPSSICFADSRTLLGYVNSTSGFELIRFSFDGSILEEQDRESKVIQGFNENIKHSGGRIYSSNGEVADANTLTLIDRFAPSLYGSGPVESSRLSGLTYFLRNNRLEVHDNETFLELDRAFLEPDIFTNQSSPLIAAGINRLAFVDRDGMIGVISNIPFIPNPDRKFVLEGTNGNDSFFVDVETREVHINGELIIVEPEVALIEFDGRGGEDRITIVGPREFDALVIMEDRHIALKSRFGLVLASDFEDVEFIGGHQDDHVIINDTPGNDRIVAFPGSCHLIGESVYLRASARTIWVNGSTGMDTAGYYGQFDTVRVAANLETNVLRITEGPYFLQIRGFDGSVSFGGQANNDTAVMIDSKLNDVAAMRPDYTRFFNANCDHRVRNFESVTLNAINGGNDRVTLYRPSGASLFQNATQATVIGPGFRNSARNFKRVNVIDD